MNHGILALLDGLGGPELFVIGVVVLLLFGSKRMPEIGRGLGRAIREFKRATSSVEENIREVLYEEPNRPRLRAPAQHRPHRGSSAGSPASRPETASSSASSLPVADPLHETPASQAPSRDAGTDSPSSPHDDTPPRRDG